MESLSRISFSGTKIGVVIYLTKYITHRLYSHVCDGTNVADNLHIGHFFSEKLTDRLYNFNRNILHIQKYMIADIRLNAIMA